MTSGRLERGAQGDGEQSPSRWSHRAPLLVLAAIGFAVATYLALHQAGLIGPVWEPFFGNGSERILGSAVAKLLPVPDAALGAAGYAAEAIVGAIGGEDRWRTSPRVVLVFVAITSLMGLGSVGLLIAQPLVFHALCTLCLTSAVISIVLAISALDEGRAALAVVRGGGQRTQTRHVERS